MFRAAGAPRSSQTTGPYIFRSNIQRELRCLYARVGFRVMQRAKNKSDMSAKGPLGRMEHPRGVVARLKALGHLKRATDSFRDVNTTHLRTAAWFAPVTYVTGGQLSS